MKNKLRHYPFIEPSFAKLLEKRKYDGLYDAIYEKGYINNGKKIKAKLYHSGLKIDEVLKLWNNSENFKIYLKRPGLFESLFKPPIWCMKAPTYSQVCDWIYDKCGLIALAHFDDCKVVCDYYWIVIDRKQNEIICQSIDFFDSHKTAFEDCLKWIILNKLK